MTGAVLSAGSDSGAAVRFKGNLSVSVRRLKAGPFPLLLLVELMREFMP
tara:strand:- start:56 stop:202 length:147 start_codon:yes stop_codon:yes gene_type:complete